MPLSGTIAVIAAVAAPQAIEQLAPPLPPARAVAAEQPVPPPAQAASVAQLPPDAKPVAQPLPRRRPVAAAAERAATQDLERATLTVIDRGQVPTPELIVREVGPATIAEIVSGVGRDPAPDTAPKPERPPR